MEDERLDPLSELLPSYELEIKSSIKEEPNSPTENQLCDQPILNNGACLKINENIFARHQVFVKEEAEITHSTDDDAASSSCSIAVVNNLNMIPNSGSSEMAERRIGRASSGKITKLWNFEMESALMELVKKFYSKLIDKFSRKKNVWINICDDLKYLDDSLTPLQVEKKWRNLVQHYKRFMENMHRTGRSRMKKPLFFNELREILGKNLPKAPRFTSTVGVVDQIEIKKSIEDIQNREEDAGEVPRLNDFPQPKLILPDTLRPEILLLPADALRPEVLLETNETEKRSRSSLKMDNLITTVDRLAKSAETQTELLKNFIENDKAFKDNILQIMMEKNRLLKESLSKQSEAGAT